MREWIEFYDSKSGQSLCKITFAEATDSEVIETAKLLAIENKLEARNIMWRKVSE